jgi:dephospho-CoA kinase
LSEVGRDKDFDEVIVVACTPETQLKRLLERGMTEAEARQRLAAQLPLEHKIARADHVIRTDGSYDETERQVRTLDRLLRGSER